MIQIEKQRDRKQNTLSFLPRKRECIKMLDSGSKSGAKVASFNENGKKTFNDPCPAGWRVISYKNLYTFFTGTPGSDGMISGNANMANSSTADADGGAYFYYTANGSGEATYVRMTGYWRFLDEFHFVGEKAIFWVREHTGITGKSSYGFSFVLGEETNSMEIAKVWYPQDAQTTRCIQELP